MSSNLVLGPAPVVRTGKTKVRRFS